MKMVEIVVSVVLIQTSLGQGALVYLFFLSDKRWLTIRLGLELASYMAN